MLINHGNTHKFINWFKVEEVNYIVHPIKKFQVLVTDGGLMKWGGDSENFKL